MITNTTEARAKLEAIIHANLSHTSEVVGHVVSEVPVDRIVKSNAITFEAFEGPSPVQSIVHAHVGEDLLVMHKHALHQASERAHVPSQYVDHLLVGAPWQRDLLGDVLTRSFANAPGRNLVRSVGNQARAILSDKFRRLDSRPIVDTFIGEVQAGGAVPYSAHANDVRVSIKAIVPTVQAIRLANVTGTITNLRGGTDAEELVAFGIELSNSDYGAGTLSVRSFLLRLVCLNGATVEDAMRQVHLGRRLGDDITYSEHTYRLDTDATVSAVRDIVRAQLGPAKQNNLVARIERASEQTVEWAHLKTQLGKALTKEELKKVGDSFESPDVVNLPPGNTAWRASNAVSWLAHSVESGDRKLELEKLAGGLLTGKVVVEAAA
jgi:hypothetical protein